MSIPAGTGRLAIIHPQIIVGDGQTVIDDGTVLIENDRITAVGPFTDIAVPEGIETLDATGNTLLPGLIDAHFHLDRLDALPTLFLQRGITSVRDPGAWIQAYAGERASGRPLPRLFLTGPHLDMYPPSYPNDAWVVDGPQEAASAVRQFAAQGASAIKIYFRSSLAVIEQVCHTADQLGLPVTAHLEKTNIYDAVDLGIDGVEHITSLGFTLLPPREAERYKQAVLRDNNARRAGRYTSWQQIDPEGEVADSLARYLARQQIFVCPTLAVFEYQLSTTNTDTVRREGFDNMMSYTRRLHEMGVPIVVGSHSYVPYSEYGWAYQREMELFEKLGMQPLEIIHAATLQNARFFRIEEDLGSIEPGKIADLLLLTADPLATIGNVREIGKVMLAGRWVPDAAGIHKQTD